MPRRVVFDGLNLARAEGTGVSTYTRLLMRVVRDLGHEVGVVYGPPRSPSKSPVLREIDFFDAKQAFKSSEASELIQYIVDQCRYHFPVKPTPVEFSGIVLARQFDAVMPICDRIFVARNLFQNARLYFSRTRAFVNLAFDSPPDIFHCTYPLPIRVRSARNVYSIHDLVPLRLPFTTLDNKRQMFRLLRKIAAEADHIVTVSEHSKRDIVQLLGVEESRVTNTYQSVEFPRECTEDAEHVIADQLEGIYGLGLNDYLLFYGALEPKKNISRLVEAYLASGANIPLVVVVSGGWNNDAEQRLLAMADGSERVPVQPQRRRVRRLDFVSRSMLAALIRGARAVVFPSLYEGFGLPVLEAMVLGTPVVSSRESSLREVAGDAALLVDPYDTREIARAITTIVNDADLRAELSRRGRIQAAKFSIDRYRERVETVYASLS
jgi:glycosyltransferase involved in cell wall biosynthesis